MIGIVAPSSLVTGMREQLEAGIATIEELGFQVRRGRHLYNEWMGLAGTHDDRAEDINRMLSDPKVRMVMAAQGGWGCLSITDRLNYTALQDGPKWVSGMSDLTLFLNALTARTGVQTLHGPNAAYSFGIRAYHEQEIPWFLSAVTGEVPLGLLPTWGGKVRVLRPGFSTGTLWGGTISVLGHLLATPWAPDLNGAILVLEGVGLSMASVHRWFQTLRLQGHFSVIRGMVLGTWDGYFIEGDDPQAALEAVVQDACAGTTFPIIQVDNIGHSVANIPWPVGGGGRDLRAGDPAALLSKATASPRGITSRRLID